MVNGVNMIIYIDYLLLGILVFLLMFTCGYCFYRIYGLRRNGQIGILLRPTKVVFSHKREGEATEELRTVVAYQNPFTGDYCVHKNRVEPKGYENSMAVLESPDSGVSDEYEPLHLDPPGPEVHVPKISQVPNGKKIKEREDQFPVKLPVEPIYDNSVNKTWNWNYKEYQI